MFTEEELESARTLLDQGEASLRSLTGRIQNQESKISRLEWELQEAREALERDRGDLDECIAKVDFLHSALSGVGTGDSVTWPDGRIDRSWNPGARYCATGIDYNPTGTPVTKDAK